MDQIIFVKKIGERRIIVMTKIKFLKVSEHMYKLINYCSYSALGPVWAENRVQSGDWYGSGTLHPVLRGSLPLLSPAF